MSRSHGLIGIDLAYAIALFGMLVANCYFIIGDHQFLLSHVHYFIFFDFFPAFFLFLNGVTISLTLRDRRVSSRRMLSYLGRRGTVLILVGLLFVKVWAMNIFLISGVFFLLAPFFAQWNNLLLRSMAVASVLFAMICVNMDVPTYPQYSALVLQGSGMKELLGFLFFNGYYSFLPWFTFFTLGILVGRGDIRPKGFFPPSSFIGLLLMGGSILAEVYSKTIYSAPEHETLILFYPINTKLFLPAFVLFEAGLCMILFPLCTYVLRNLKRSPLMTFLQNISSSKYSLYFLVMFFSMLILSVFNLVIFKQGPILFALTIFLCWLAWTLVRLWKKRINEKPPIEWVIKRISGSTKP